MDDSWEVRGQPQRSLAAAGACATWLGSMEKLAGWEYVAATIADGTHRVLRRRKAGAETGEARQGLTDAAPPSRRT